jgi:putative DNA primase/helicase
MSGRDWQAFDAELRVRAPEIAAELLGKPSSRTGQEWRWGRKGSLAVVIAGARTGMWFDHEAGTGGGLVELVARTRGLSRREALDWTADRIGMAGDVRQLRQPANRAKRRAADIPDASALATPQRGQVAPANTAARPEATSPAATAAARAGRLWEAAHPAPAHHPYLCRKQVGPHGLRCDSAGNLIVPLRDVEGVLHTIETITPAGEKRYLAGGAKAGHFCTIGGPLGTSAAFLICEGWATGASLHEATGLPVVAAMDAGNLGPVADVLRRSHPAAAITIVADNDDKPGRDINPGVRAATKAATAIDARLAIPLIPGDANDLGVQRGADAVATMVASAAFVPPPAPTYPEPVLTPEAARAELAQALQAFMASVPAYWRAIEEAEAEAEASPADALDFNAAPDVLPPVLGLPVDVGLGKSSSARTAIASLLASGALGSRKVAYAVPRHDLGQEQVEAFQALGVRAMLWKGRTAPDPTPENPEQLMCLDPEATFDALEVEQAIEQSCCKVKRGGELHLCPHFHACGYQRQKAAAQAAQVIVCAHDSVFHMKPDAVGTVGLLVMDEAFWQSGLRGLDGKAVLTQDGLEPGTASVTCHGSKGRSDMAATADLIAARHKLHKALQVTEPGPLAHGLLQSVGLTAEECRNAARLERRRLRDPGLLPGMGPVERRRRIEKVLPPHGQPWAPPGRCATLWLILAEALEGQHDAAGAVLVNELTEHGTVRALKLRWRGRLRGGWAGEVPVLHLDATLRPQLVRPYLPHLAVREPVAATMPYVRVRHVLGSPTSAKALTPTAQAPERDRKSAAHHLRDLLAYIRLRSRELRATGRDTDLLVVGQKAAIDALRAAGLPPRVDAVHFNGLSGLDRWGGVGGLIVLGRTLPAPATVESLCAALTAQTPVAATANTGWWYGSEERRIGLAGGRTHAVPGEVHPDPTAEAIRWSICEAELIQAMGRGRGVNRTAARPLQIDLLTDVVLPVTVSELIDWQDLRPTRRDLMAARGVVLENAADMARCFPDLWDNHEAARKDGQRSGTNGYYRIFYNSKMSHSSVAVSYRPEGSGQKLRRAVFDLGLIRDPEAWLTRRLGPLAVLAFDPPARPATQDADGLGYLSRRLHAAMVRDRTARVAALDALNARLSAAAPAGRRPTPDLFSQPTVEANP